MKIDLTQVTDCKVVGVDKSDYPDFVDAYIDSATYQGRPMTQEELDTLNSDYFQWVYDKVIESLTF